MYEYMCTNVFVYVHVHTHTHTHTDKTQTQTQTDELAALHKLSYASRSRYTTVAFCVGLEPFERDANLERDAAERDEPERFPGLGHGLCGLVEDVLEFAVGLSGLNLLNTLECGLSAFLPVNDMPQTRCCV